MRDEHFLDLAGVDVLAAPDDHLLEPPGDAQVAAVVHRAEVAGAAVRPAASAGHDGPAGDGLAAELAEHCRARLAAAKVPVRWLVTGSFPMTASGKVRKDVLRDQLTAASAERAPGG